MTGDRIKNGGYSLCSLVAIFGGGNFLSMFLRIAGGVLTARFVLPSELGLFNGIGLVLGYLPFLQLGVLKDLGRELPYYIGKGQKTKLLKWLLLKYGLLLWAVEPLSSCYSFLPGKG
jgi:hypothetical protein